jgi:hypothetical protein
MRSVAENVHFHLSFLPKTQKTMRKRAVKKTRRFKFCVFGDRENAKLRAFPAETLSDRSLRISARNLKKNFENFVILVVWDLLSIE